MQFSSAHSIRCQLVPRFTRNARTYEFLTAAMSAPVHCRPQKACSNWRRLIPRSRRTCPSVSSSSPVGWNPSIHAPARKSFSIKSFQQDSRRNVYYFAPETNASHRDAGLRFAIARAFAKLRVRIIVSTSYIQICWRRSKTVVENNRIGRIVPPFVFKLAIFPDNYR